MSYYPGQQASSSQQPATATYAYGAYAQSYPYQPGQYQWPYPYYVPPTQLANRPTVQPVPPPVTAAAPVQPARAPTFSSYIPPYPRDSSTTNVGQGRASRKSTALRGLFTKELKSLMYGFGDDRNPANDTVNVMEEILIEYITDVCQVAGGHGRKSRLSVEDLRRALSRPADSKKLARMEELIFMQEDIKRARAQFEESEIHNPKAY